MTLTRLDYCLLCFVCVLLASLVPWINILNSIFHIYVHWRYVSVLVKGMQEPMKKFNFTFRLCVGEEKLYSFVCHASFYAFQLYFKHYLDKDEISFAIKGEIKWWFRSDVSFYCKAVSDYKRQCNRISFYGFQICFRNLNNDLKPEWD